MKRFILTGFIVLIAVFSFTACGSKNEPSSKNDSSKSDKEVLSSIDKEVESAIKEAESQAAKEEKIEFEYEEDDFLGGIRVTHYLGVDKEISIPAKIEGKPVVAVGHNKISLHSSLCRDERMQEALTNITIPEGVVEIGVSLFKDCKNLKSIQLPNSIETIGAEAFWGCEGLTQISIPYVKFVGDGALYGCKGIEQIDILTLKNEVKFDGQFALCLDEASGKYYIPQLAVKIEGSIIVNFVNG